MGFTRTPTEAVGSYGGGDDASHIACGVHPGLVYKAGFSRSSIISASSHPHGLSMPVILSPILLMPRLSKVLFGSGCTPPCGIRVMFLCLLFFKL
ncbi:hypothetical protein JCGZ_02455 [Jatropha curcas]|uniref:Uncharacterized protein n=1 Tax=Jatropha curcas TaxID=180498 RepID=A0A067L1U9_JATCU|nr:hypothetical protein JCGZ_02454 [Jatropha curcas]KDP42398.1 hypothetical protein JCGZ_02455 [Jatropha curcas]